MKSCWPRSPNCFFIASTTFISSLVSSAIFFILSMTWDFSTRAFIISSTATLHTLTAAGCSMRSFTNSSFCSMTRAHSIFTEELLFSCSFFQLAFSSFLQQVELVVELRLVLLKLPDFAGHLLTRGNALLQQHHQD